MKLDPVVLGWFQSDRDWFSWQIFKRTLDHRFEYSKEIFYLRFECSRVILILEGTKAKNIF